MSLVHFHRYAAGCHSLGERLKAHWRFKLTASVLMPAGFFVVYFLLLYFPVFPVTEVPTTALDRLVGFWSTTLLVYITLWFYVPLASWIVADRQQLVVQTKALGVLGLVGLALFFLRPTSVPRVPIDLAEYPSFALLVAIDEPRNVFPCLHGAFAVFSAICIGRLLGRLGASGLVRGLNWCWCLGILYSALATKQHMVIDLSAGTALGAVWGTLYPRLFARPLAGPAGDFGARLGRPAPACTPGGRDPSDCGIRAVEGALRVDTGTPMPRGGTLPVHDHSR